MPRQPDVSPPGDKPQLLRQIKLFAALDESQLELIAQTTRLVEYKKEEVVYREGEAADAFYVVVSGRLKVYTTAAGGEKVYTYLHGGDSFGEISLLTGETHSATVKAVNDTLVLELGKTEFDDVINRIPSLVLYLSRLLSKRLRSKEGLGGEFAEATIVAVYSAAHRVGRTLFAVNLAASLSRETRREVILVDLSQSGQDISRRLRLSPAPPLALSPDRGFINDAVVMRHLQTVPSFGFRLMNVGHPVDQTDDRFVAPLLSLLTAQAQFIVLDLPTQVDLAVFKALTQSDIIFLMTDQQQDNLIRTRALHQRLTDSIAEAGDKIHVVLNTGAPAQSGDQPGLAQDVLGRPAAYVLPRFNPDDPNPEPEELLAALERIDLPYAKVIRRIAREIGRILVGLALGSGAALGLAHIGVLKVFEREHVPVDLLAGSSMGALVAAHWALGKPVQELEEIANRLQRKRDLWRLLDWGFLLPLHGVFKGSQIVRQLHRDLEGATFAQTQIPLKIIAANPWSREEIVIDSGPLSEAVRASIAIPGIFEPVSTPEGHVYVDGGVASPVPVGVLRRYGAKRVIAVNVFPTSEEIRTWVEGQRRLKAARAAAMARQPLPVRAINWLGDRLTRKPWIADVVMRSMQMMEFSIAEAACRDADITLRPTVPRASWVEFYSPDKFIRQGERAAEAALPELRKLIES